MFKAYSNFQDKGKFIIISLATVIITLLGAYGLSLIDSDSSRVTQVDGVYYENNPWTKHNN